LKKKKKKKKRETNVRSLERDRPCREPERKPVVTKTKKQKLHEREKLNICE
jgi:hypothetical protein